MKKILHTHHPRRQIKSFKFAFQGIFHAMLHEANFRVQLTIALIALSLGIYLKISTTEWAILTLSMGILLSAEMINTVIENVMDALFKEHQEVVKVIKDVSAGFVLISAVTALINMILIFSQPLLLLVL
ncbi:diacylglycerol kinase family protein [Patescibacteria group bacterium]